MAGQTILIADDEQNIREVVRFALERAGFRVLEAVDGQSALDTVATARPDLLVLDIVMPGLDGTEVCRQLRLQSRVPIVFLTSLDDEVDRILGLEIGGDDYITKPFSPRELVARVRAVLRRFAPPKLAPPEVTTHGRLAVDTARFLATWDGVEITLTVTEFGILETLIGGPGRVFTRDQLMSAVWGPQVVVSDRTIDSHVRRLRRKFEAVGGQPVQTVHGLGYKLAPCSGAPA